MLFARTPSSCEQPRPFESRGTHKPQVCSYHLPILVLNSLLSFRLINVNRPQHPRGRFLIDGLGAKLQLRVQAQTEAERICP